MAQPLSQRRTESTPPTVSHVFEAVAPCPHPPVAVGEARPAGSPGPIVVWHRLESRFAGRLYALVVAGIAFGMLAVAAGLTPSRNHMGSHRQLGLPPCGFVLTTGYPCPTCGMTTAFTHLVRGHLMEAARSSVFGAILACGTVLAGASALGCAVTGRYPNLNWHRVDAVKLVYGIALLLVLSWAFKMAVGLADGSLPAR
ncbi:MAG TPA: DUF2752 domain-containing protein [Phycisphaerae bacterium]|nr:DUF2752 domain-containing protein [Phycisphaerae bacterium]